LLAGASERHGQSAVITPTALFLNIYHR
jgi:hypothetical protein